MAAVEQLPTNEDRELLLPVRKRKKPEVENSFDIAFGTPAESSAIAATKDDSGKLHSGMTKGRENRLEQNRKAAKESRRRKKVMIEELQRSVIFFSRANSTLKHQNDDLTRLLMQAQAQVSDIENSETAPLAAPVAVATETKPIVAVMAPVVAQPTSAAAAAMTGSLPPMQPGATMQAMANFQQAAAAAMQAAVQGMKGIPGVSMQALAAPASGASSTNSQQAYDDTMTALAMQQAAAAAAAAAGATTQQPQFLTTLAPDTVPVAPAPGYPMEEMSV
jgi:hypothetical protein